jgi:hypothetical protein
MVKVASFFFLFVLMDASQAHAATLSWTDTSSNENGFIVQRRCDGEFSFADMQPFVDANITTYPIETPEGRICEYQVIAYNIVGRSGPSNVVSWANAAGDAPPQPTTLTVTETSE